MPIAHSGSACTHPFGLSFDEMQLLDSGGSLIFGNARISSDIINIPPVGNLLRVESAGVVYLPHNAINVALAAPMLLADDSKLGCALDELEAGGSEGFSASALNIGDNVTLTGNGRTVQLPGAPPFIQYGVLVSKEGPVTSPDQFTESFFSPGGWTLSSNGNGVFDPIVAAIQLPPQPRLLDCSSLRRIDRAQDLRLAWDPSGYVPSDILKVVIHSGVSASPGSGFTSTSHHITCRVAAIDGRVTIPSSSLQLLAADSAAYLDIEISSGQPVVATTRMVGGGLVRTLFGFTFDQRFWLLVQ
jgi:hypothetical protein